jgi:N-acetylglutamate synthase-like GNAT family acetyltransferase
MKTISLDDISIRTTIKPGDLGYVTYLHATLYKQEYDFGLEFEIYVAKTLAEFYEQYDVESNRFWICEHEEKIIGSIALMNRGESAQLRYFLLLPEYRAIGLGKKMMSLCMEFMKQCNYRKCYLLTTDELGAAASLYTRHGFKLTKQTPSASFGKQLVEQRYDWSAE